MRLHGSVTVPGDKSVSHRVVLFSLLGRGRMRVENLSPGADVMSSLGAARLLGVTAEKVDNGWVLGGLEGRVRESADIDCGNSGTTIRLLMGLLAGRPGRFTLDGDESLRRRPMERIAAPLRLMGAEIETTDGTCPVTVRGGKLTGIQYDLPVASAQLKSACLLAGIQADGETLIAEPGPSRDHTERMLVSWGARLKRDGQGLTVSRSILSLPERFLVPGDASSAAFFLCAAAIIPGSRVVAENVMLNPTRTGFIDVLRRMGARIQVETQGEDPEPWGRITADYSPDLAGVTVTGPDLPGLVDEVPILALVATQAIGETVFENAGELRIKETDRLAAVESQLGAMGAAVRAEGDRLVIRGKTALAAPAAGLESYGDHRMAMTLRLALVLAGRDAPIVDEACARVSYPGFHHDLENLLA